MEEEDEEDEAEDLLLGDDDDEMIDTYGEMISIDQSKKRTTRIEEVLDVEDILLD